MNAEDPNTEIRFSTGILGYSKVDVGINRYGVKRLQRKLITLKNAIEELRRIGMDKNIDDELMKFFLDALQKNAAAVEMATNEAERSAALKESMLTWHKQIVDLQNLHRSELRDRMDQLKVRTEEHLSRIDKRLSEIEGDQDRLIEYKVKMQSSLDTLHLMVILVPGAIAALAGFISHIILISK